MRHDVIKVCRTNVISRRIATVRTIVIITRLNACFDRNQRAIFFLPVTFTVFEIYLSKM